MVADAVIVEPVSVNNFLGNRKNTGNLPKPRPAARRRQSRKPLAKGLSGETFDATEQGISGDKTGIAFWVAGEPEAAEPEFDQRLAARFEWSAGWSLNCGLIGFSGLLRLPNCRFHGALGENRTPDPLIRRKCAGVLPDDQSRDGPTHRIETLTDENFV